jgi:hypothetical protein
LFILLDVSNKQQKLFSVSVHIFTCLDVFLKKHIIFLDYPYTSSVRVGEDELSPYWDPILSLLVIAASLFKVFSLSLD